MSWTENIKNKAVMDNVEVKDDVICHGTIQAKNACTAWVNFDGTTTPPTIRDSYNVKSVIRVGTGQYDIYFEEPMDNTNYTWSNSVGKNNTATAVCGARSQLISDDTTSKFRILTSYATSTALNFSHIKLQIFGGKN